MFDTAPPVPQMQRTHGRAHVAIDGGGLRDLHQSGSAKAMLPRMHGAPPEVVFLNTAGGVTGGDHLRFSLALGAGARATATTQTAERAYASTGVAGRIDVALRVAAGARLDWLPQETILFEASHLDRRTRIDLTGDAAILCIESVVLGRIAMGETLRHMTFHDRREIWRDGTPLLIEPLCLDAASLANRGPAGLGDALALASLALVTQGAEDAVGQLRALVGDMGAVSGWDGKCVVRLMGRDAFALRRRLAAMVQHLRGGTLPRVWQS